MSCTGLLVSLLAFAISVPFMVRYSIIAYRRFSEFFSGAPDRFEKWLFDIHDEPPAPLPPGLEEIEDTVRGLGLDKWAVWVYRTGAALLGSVSENWCSLTIGFIVMLLLFMTSRSAVRVVKIWMMRGSLRLRGYRFEAMREGSVFMSGAVPHFQVELREAGLFGSKFVGYGIRVKDVLVTPVHVIDSMDNVVVVGNKSSVVVPRNYVQSEIVADLAYIHIPNVTWSRMGVPEARPSPVESNTMARCTGREGASVGFVKRMPQLGMLSFAGSTVPGMSGAAYVSGTSVVGIHDGVSGSENVGISIFVVLAELETMLLGESEHREGGETESEKRAKKLKNTYAHWNRQELTRAARANLEGRSAKSPLSIVHI